MKRGEIVRNKTGQFYLVAAIVISVIIISLVTMSNYSRRQETTTMQVVGEELKIESEKVLDFGTYNNYSQIEMKNLMGNFTSNYINYVRNGGDFYFLFGNSNLIKVVGYSQTDTLIHINTGTQQSNLQINAGETSSQEFNSPSNNIIITINGEDYLFELEKGENFYFVIVDNAGGENYVITN